MFVAENPTQAKAPSRISTEVYTIPLADRYLVYAPLKRVAFLGNAALVSFLWRLRQGLGVDLSPEERPILAFLKKMHLVGREGDAPILTGGNTAYKPTEVTLFLTTQCNLRCIYCYASTGAHQATVMSLATAKRGMDFVCQNALELGRKEIGLGFHGGGEPTAAWDILIKSHAYAKELVGQNHLKMRASVATNGVLSRARREWIIENLQGVSLSLDGLPGVQDTQRPRQSGRPSSPSVFQTLAAFETAAFPYGVRMTVTALSVDRLAESVAHLLTRAHPKRIQVEPVYDLGRGQEKSLHVDPQAFIAAFLQARRIANEHHVDLFYSAARVDVLTNRFCRSCGEGFSLTPTGNVSACYEIYEDGMAFASEFIFGRFDPPLNRFVFDEEKLRRLRERTVETIPWCQDCFCKWHCAGDCPNKSRHGAVDGEFAGHSRCEITRALVLDQILAKIAAQGGTVWASEVQ